MADDDYMSLRELTRRVKALEARFLDSATDEALAADQAKDEADELFSDPAESQPDPLDLARAINAKLINKDDVDLPAEGPLTDWEKGEGVAAVPDIPESIAKLMAADHSLSLTEAFERRINTLNNARLNLSIKDEEETELDALLEQYHELAKRGDRS